MGHELSAPHVDTLEEEEEDVRKNRRTTSELVDSNVAVILNDLDFDGRSRGNIKQDARTLASGFMDPHPLLERYSIDLIVLTRWIEAIAEKYNQVPYHCWRHAFDVFQFSYMAITVGVAHKFFNYQDILAMFIAIIAHDVGHLGVNNNYLIQTGHQLALTYNDKSVLENMHASVCFMMLGTPGLNFLADQPKPQYANLREKVIDAILATDMAHHFEFVDRFTARVSAQEMPFQEDTKDDRSRQKTSKGDRRMLLQAFTHMADLGHCCRPWKVHKHMVVLLEEEFFLQGDREKEAGLPVMPLMNRNQDSAATAQGFFLDKMVIPLLVPYTNLLLPDLGKRLLDNIEENKQRWAQLVEKHGKKTAAELVPLDNNAPTI